MLRSLFVLIFAILPLSALRTQPPAVDHILFAGNSITWTPSQPGRWWGDYGCCVSSASRAFASLVWAGISARQGIVPEMSIYKGRVISPEDIGQPLFDAIADVDLAVIQTGEAFPVDQDQTWWNSTFAPLGVLARETGARIIVAGIFGTKTTPEMTAGMQERMRLAVELAGLEFVPLGHLRKAENLAYADGLCDDPGICGHPGDAGHRGIADAVLAGLYGGNVYLPWIASDNSTIPP